MPTEEPKAPTAQDGVQPPPPDPAAQADAAAQQAAADARARDERGRFRGKDGAQDADAQAVAAARAEALKALPATFREAFEGEYDDDELDAIREGLTAAQLQALPPQARAVLRASLRHDADQAKAREADAKKAADALLARENALKAKEQEMARREAAARAVALSPAVADPGAPPQVDPLSPEGAAALSRFYAQKGLAEAMAPTREAAIQADRDARWAGLVSQYPDLGNVDKDGNPTGVAAEFFESLKAANQGVDLKKSPPRVTTEQHAARFFLERELAKYRADEKARADRVAAERAEGARAMARAGAGGGQPSALDRFNRLLKQDPDAAWELAERDPEIRSALNHKRGWAASA